jgi:hypothetical protein
LAGIRDVARKNYQFGRSIVYRFGARQRHFYLEARIVEAEAADYAFGSNPPL